MFPSFSIRTPSGRLIEFTAPVVMSILNCTPDSFHAGSRVETTDQILMMAEQHLAAGADILDIGGVSSRPGAEAVSAQEEADRVLPALEAIKQTWPECVVSIDTYRSEIANFALRAGADMINDISAGALDAELIPTVAKYRSPYILMHMQGVPASMQANPQYHDVTTEIIDFLVQKVQELRQAGVVDIWVDPGFGFGKTLDQNYRLLRELTAFQVLGCPLMVGLSRKSMIYKLLGNTAEQALNGTTALHMAALERGARILRVHDTLQAKEVVRLWSALVPS